MVLRHTHSDPSALPPMLYDSWHCQFLGENKGHFEGGRWWISASDCKVMRRG